MYHKSTQEQSCNNFENNTRYLRLTCEERIERYIAPAEMFGCVIKYRRESTVASFCFYLRLRDKLKLVFNEPASVVTSLLLAATLPVQQIAKFLRVPVGWSGCSPGRILKKRFASSNYAMFFETVCNTISSRKNRSNRYALSPVYFAYFFPIKYQSTLLNRTRKFSFTHHANSMS